MSWFTWLFTVIPNKWLASESSFSVHWDFCRKLICNKFSILHVRICWSDKQFLDVNLRYQWLGIIGQDTGEVAWWEELSHRQSCMHNSPNCFSTCSVWSSVLCSWTVLSSITLFLFCFLFFFIGGFEIGFCYVVHAEELSWNPEGWNYSSEPLCTDAYFITPPRESSNTVQNSNTHSAHNSNWLLSHFTVVSDYGSIPDL